MKQSDISQIRYGQPRFLPGVQAAVKNEASKPNPLAETVVAPLPQEVVDLVAQAPEEAPSPEPVDEAPEPVTVEPEVVEAPEEAPVEEVEEAPVEEAPVEEATTEESSAPASKSSKKRKG